MFLNLKKISKNNIRGIFAMCFIAVCILLTPRGRWWLNGSPKGKAIIIKKNEVHTKYGNINFSFTMKDTKTGVVFFQCADVNKFYHHNIYDTLQYDMLD